MAAPIANKIIIPDDSGNLGKKVRTQSRAVGADTVHEHFFIEARQAEVLGVYRRAMDQQTIAAAAQNGTSTGFLWAHVPIAVTNKWARLRRIYFSSQHATVLATPTAPRIACSLFTFTGSASGASITAGKINSSFPSAILDLRTAVTGLTVTMGQKIAAGAILGALTAVGAYSASPDINIMDPGEAEDEWPIIKPGEGIVLWQDTAGTTLDTRKFNPVLVWDEIDVA